MREELRVQGSGFRVQQEDSQHLDQDLVAVELVNGDESHVFGVGSVAEAGYDAACRLAECRAGGEGLFCLAFNLKRFRNSSR